MDQYLNDSVKMRLADPIPLERHGTPYFARTPSNSMALATDSAVQNEPGQAIEHQTRARRPQLV
ncbi:hypothetical protein GCM10017674_27490 [Streptomyces gardneri]|uniref:Uncharacterized protein n=1 Tax=Streptomyces gardneri TaxID=66892 RepID=A0A4Y3RL31_9ACTN|nr:hypothetical protein SGA01_36840 [Streptomyces gardneri]GHG95695.1 hypothetical protein GCM10017674_27490 [Streptomyces gardneri]